MEFIDKCMKSFKNAGILLLLSMSIFLAVLDLFVVNVAVPSIKTSLNGNNAEAMFIVVAYGLGYAAFLITGSIAGNILGKKKVYMWGMLSFTLFSFLCSIAVTALQLNVFRFFQGISGAFMVPQGIGMIPYVFPDVKERTKAFGIYGSFAGAASVIGQFLGGYLPELNVMGIEGWRFIFILNIPLGGLTLILGMIKLKEVQVMKPVSFDFPGLGLLTISLLTLIYPLVEGNESHWPVWSIIMLLCSFVLFALFYFYEKSSVLKGKTVLIDVTLFSIKELNVGIIAAVFYYIAQDSYFFLNAFYMQNSLNLSSIRVGNLFVLQGIGYVIASLFSVKLLIKYDYKLMIAGSLLMMITLWLHIQYFTAAGIGGMIVYAILFLYGMGCGIMLPTMMTMTMRNIPPDLTAPASGLYLTVQQISIALGVSIIGGTFFHILGSGREAAAMSSVAYKYSTYINILALLMVGLIFFFSGRQKNKQ